MLNVLNNDESDVNVTPDETTNPILETTPVSDDPQIVQYRFGNKKINLGTYIYNLDENVVRYLNSKKWSPEKKEEFRNQYQIYINALNNQLTKGETESSIYTDQFGTIWDPSDTLVGDTDDLYYNKKDEQINKTQYDQLKTRKQKKFSQFNASEEVARYFYEIGTRINPIGAPVKKERKKFDIKTMGFASWWQQQNNKTGGPTDMTPYISKDNYNKELGKRLTTNRTKYFADELRKYIEHIDVYKDYDWPDNESFESYKENLELLLRHLGDQWDQNDKIRANQAGINPEFYNKLFTEEAYPHLSSEEKAALIEAEKAENEAKKSENELQHENNYINQVLSDFYAKRFKFGKVAAFDEHGNPQSQNNVILIPNTTTQITDEDLTKNHTSIYKNYGYNSATHAFKGVINKVINDEDLTDADKTAFHLVTRQLISKNKANILQTVDGNNCLAFKFNDETAIVIYDIDNRELYIAPILAIKGMREKLYKEQLYKEGKRSPESIYHKKGGVINRAQFGIKLQSYNDIQDLSDIYQHDYEEEIKAAAKNKGISYEEEKASRRRVGTWYAEAESTDLEPNAGFTENDKRRLISIGLEAGSLLAAFIPGANVASSVIGAGSSVTNFIADVKEDGFQKRDLWNLGKNLAMDVLGMIPVAGGGIKGAKLIKSLVKYVPRIVAAIGAAGTIMNGPQIIASFNKLSNQPSELTVDDWRNIVNGLNFITGASAAGLRKKSKTLIQEKNKYSDTNAVAVEMKNSTGKKQILLFEGSDAKKIREADGRPEKIKEITSKYKAYEDWDVSTEDSHSMWRGFTDNEGKFHLNPFKSRVVKGPAKVYDKVYEDFNIFGHSRNNGKLYAEVPDDRWYASNDRIKIDEVAVSNKDLAETHAFADLISEDSKIATKHSKKAAELRKLQQKYEKSKKRDSKRNKRESEFEIDDIVEVTNSDGFTYNEISYNDITPKFESKKSKKLRKDIEDIERELDHMNDNYNRLRREFDKKYVKRKRRGKIVEIPVYGSNEVIRADADEIFKKHGLRFEKKGGTIIKALKGTSIGFDTLDETNQKIKRWNTIREIIDNPTLKYGMTRAIKGIMDNNKIIDIKRNANKPVYKTLSDESNIKFEAPTLDIETQGHKKAADLEHYVHNNLMTSDADRNTAINFETVIKGLEYVDQAQAESNEITSKAKQFYNQQAQANIKARQEDADYNKLAGNQTMVIDSDYEAARIKGNNDIKSRFSEQLEELELGENAIEQQESQVELNQNIETALRTNLKGVGEAFGITIPEEQIDIWTKYKNNQIKYSELNDLEKQTLNEVMQTVSLLASKMRNKASGRYPSMWADYVLFAPTYTYKIDQDPSKEDDN